MPQNYVLAIDQGTTGTRALVLDASGRCLGSAALELGQHYPQPGWVEHDADEIWEAVAKVVPRSLEEAGVGAGDLAAIGITNQRETSILWERNTGKPVARALVWQDRRTANFCREHKGDEAWITSRTGLVLDPYFSATKLNWLLTHGEGLRARADAGQLAWGTVDSFLIWRLTGGKVHATDVSNASRTLLLNLKTAAWDKELCKYFGVPESLLPQVRPSAADYGTTRGLGFLPDGLPIAGVAGDQQAALFGQRAFAAGEAKCTYGTGAFFLLHTGDQPILSRHHLLSTLAATTSDQPQYALEGSVFIAGAAVGWLRDGLKLIEKSMEVEKLAADSDREQPVIFVPGLVGLGAPHWVPEARGVLFGLTPGTTRAELSRAALEGVGFQVADLMDAARKDAQAPLHNLQVDGGMAKNAWFLQFQADILGIPVQQAGELEATALGAAYLAGLRTGVWKDLDALRRLPRTGKSFTPKLAPEDRERRLRDWRRAVEAVIAFYKPHSE
jgi:glycerol kinase